MGVDDTVIGFQAWQFDKVEIIIDGRPIGKPVDEAEAKAIVAWLPTALADLAYFQEITPVLKK